ncbi:alpha,alpha-trehalase TreF [Alteromonas sp. C1M14]|uniref:alpha,alpha-trehalase TreF n=1 Tax=Alteromonas sp. C1M14 TaxID=2841567 RepID=UPI001C0958AE|nr:alpha,alpha-trehalase TreF [Alteromonas sp. C1M14]MBU2977767.1 alpha,alpha-trehalase TreF [Alteromonas sp. C1M14]
MHNTVDQAWRGAIGFYQSSLFKRVQMSSLFADSKTFADAIPKAPWNIILQAYDRVSNGPDFSLKDFIYEQFDIPAPVSLQGIQTASDMQDYIQHMWKILARQPDQSRQDSLIPLPYEYIVPGGRFREIYYWDSYFTALGLIEAGHAQMAQAMLKNFLYLIDTVGHVPNGNRAYYHSRSQPPILGLMTDLLIGADNTAHPLFEAALHGMEKEYQFWMSGEEALVDDWQAHRRVMRLENGAILNRYWDDDDSPRPESYREDTEAASHVAPEQRASVYRHIRAACESGWDFSSRWFKDPQDITSIRTTDVVPVDLNSLLFRLEKQLAQWFGVLGNEEKHNFYVTRADERRRAINTYLYHDSESLYLDFLFSERTNSEVVSAACYVPLAVGLASKRQADAIAKITESTFLQAGGIITTPISSGQQWDAPNGWAPLQWFAVEGLERYGYLALADKIKTNWLSSVERKFTDKAAMLEKYDVCNTQQEAGGGEYEVQLGFGWTNGVTALFLSTLPE